MSNAETAMSKKCENVKKAFIEKNINDKVNEEIYDNLKFPLDKDSCGDVQYEIRRTHYIPC